MFPQAYLDFDLAFQASNRGYEARVLNSPAGQALTQFRLPFSEAEAHPPHEQVNTLDAIQAWGSQLFDTIFAGELLHCFRRSQEVARQQNVGLRIRLRFTDSPALAPLPWEYLYDSIQANFLSLSETTPIVRFLEIPRPLQPFTFQLPLRFLLVAANPAQLPPLASDQECRAIGEALRPQGQQEIILEQRYGATLQTVQQTLQNHAYHVLHFSGHAGFDEGTQAGMIYLQDEEGLAVAVAGRQLSVLSDELASVRLVVLNAGETGRASPTNFYGGVAQSLVQQGIPAVIAMQFPISERLAITFAQAFYTALANSVPVEVALSRARKVIYLQGDTVGWGTPVLFMRTPNGQLFATDRTPAEDAVISEKPNFWQKLGWGRIIMIKEPNGAEEERLPPVHPGEVLLEDFMKPLGLSQYRLAQDLGVPALRISQIVHGKRAVTADTALRLARYFGTSANVWMRLQARYDLEVAEAALAERVKREVKVHHSQTPIFA